MGDDGQKSCLVSKLAHYVDLSHADDELLRSFESEECDYRKRDIVRQEGDRIHDLFVVKRGWFFGFTMLPNGKRQVHRLYFPGDFIGTHEVVYDRATYDISASSAGTLCPFEKQGLHTIFQTSPRLTAPLRENRGASLRQQCRHPPPFGTILSPRAVCHR